MKFSSKITSLLLLASCVVSNTLAAAPLSTLSAKDRNAENSFMVSLLLFRQQYKAHGSPCEVSLFLGVTNKPNDTDAAFVYSKQYNAAGQLISTQRESRKDGLLSYRQLDYVNSQTINVFEYKQADGKPIFEFQLRKTATGWEKYIAKQSGEFAGPVSSVNREEHNAYLKTKVSPGKIEVASVRYMPSGWLEMMLTVVNGKRGSGSIFKWVKKPTTLRFFDTSNYNQMNLTIETMDKHGNPKLVRLHSGRSHSYQRYDIKYGRCE